MPNKTLNDLLTHVAFDKANDIVHLYQPGAPGEKDRKSTLQDIIDLLDTNTSFANIPYLDKSNTFTQDNVFQSLVNIGNNPSPVGLLEVYSASANVTARIQTDLVNGFANLVLNNDAQSWVWQLTNTDTLRLLDDTGGTFPWVIEPGVPSNTLYLDSSGTVIIGSAAPIASAKLQIDSTVGAFVLPRMTTTQRDLMTPTNGMRIYNLTTNQFEGYQAGAWVNI